MKNNPLLFCVLAGCLIVAPGAMLAQTPGNGGTQSTPNNPTNPTPQTMPETMPGGAGANGQGQMGPATPKVNDHKFVKEAAMGGLAEVELGKLAQEKATSPAVKQFAQRMVQDHSKANDQLKQVAEKEGVAVPSSLDSKHQKRIDKLSKLSGTAFDKAYIKDQLKDHKKDVSEFKDEANHGTKPDVKSFASETLPTLEQHLSMVKALDKSGGTSLEATASAE
jgi:putative membrane protein